MPQVARKSVAVCSDPQEWMLRLAETFIFHRRQRNASSHTHTHIYVQSVRVKFCHQFLGISGSAIKKCFKQHFFLVSGGLHVSIFLNLRECFLRRKVKVTFFKWHRTFSTGFVGLLLMSRRTQQCCDFEMTFKL